jgi:hypothetical protein
MSEITVDKNHSCKYSNLLRLILKIFYVSVGEFYFVVSRVRNSRIIEIFINHRASQECILNED